MYTCNINTLCKAWALQYCSIYTRFHVYWKIQYNKKEHAQWVVWSRQSTKPDIGTWLFCRCKTCRNKLNSHLVGQGLQTPSGNGSTVKWRWKTYINRRNDLLYIDLRYDHVIWKNMNDDDKNTTKESYEQQFPNKALGLFFRKNENNKPWSSLEPMPRHLRNILSEDQTWSWQW